MKKYWSLILLSVVISCKPTAYKNDVVNLESICPKDGSCNVKIVQNKGVTTEADENSENFHYELVSNTAKSTVIFEYSKNVPKGVMDAGLREEVILEIDNNTKQGKYNVSSAVFGRFCYCKGATGYYKIKSGVLTVTEKNQMRHFNFRYTVNEVPQLLQSIDFTIK